MPAVEARAVMLTISPLVPVRAAFVEIQLYVAVTLSPETASQ